jgi:hypothetical protein
MGDFDRGFVTSVRSKASCCPAAAPWFWML